MQKGVTLITLQFKSEALPYDTFQILSFDGTEEISKLYYFEIHLVSRDPDIDFGSVLKSSAQLAITAQGNTRYLNGMLSEFEQRGQWQNGLYEYRAVLVPRLWIMAQSTQNQIFQELTVPDIIESELCSVNKKGNHPLVMDGLSVDDYAIYTIRNYDEREYVVQYKETDHNFISRLMEHEGIYYYFEQDNRREKLVVTDAMATEEIGNDSYAMFQTEAFAGQFDSNVVYSFIRLQKQIPDRLLVNDYNYRSPSIPMQSDFPVTQDDVGIGFITEFGAHFKEPEQGEILATLRTEEYRCRKNVYTGESNIAAMTCAGLYSLGQHFRREYNQTYMVTRVQHSGSQTIESWGNVGATHYKNEFDCIPSGIPYRPQRLTPKPKLYGIMNGTIDSELDTGRADIDELGRYKVKMPFDISGASEGMGSRRIRMAQPYGGGGSGMSFPLVKGTEVIWTCIDGDIDRPIITGAVPNPMNPSVTTAENNNSNVIKTSSGIAMGFHDGTGNGGQNSTGDSDGLAAQKQYQKTGGANQSALKSSQLPLQHQQMSADILNISGLTDPSSDASSFDNDGGGAGKQWSIAVPDYDPSSQDKDTYVRYGMPSRGESTMSDFFGNDGILSYTDGNMYSYTKESRHDMISSGNYTFSIGDSGDGLLPQGYTDIFSVGNTRIDLSALFMTPGTTHLREIWDATSTVKYALGDHVNLAKGFNMNAALSTTNMNVLGSFQLGGAPDIVANIAGRYTLSGLARLDTTFKEALSAALINEVSGVTEVKMNVKPPVGVAATLAQAKANLGIGVGALAIPGAISGINATVQQASGRSDEGKLAGAAVGMSALLIAQTVLSISLDAQMVAHMKLPPAAELNIKPTKIRLGIGPGPTAPVMPGIEIGLNKITIGYGPTSQIVITPEGITIEAKKLKLNGVSVEVGTNMTQKLDLKGAKVGVDGKASVEVKAPSIKTVGGLSSFG